MVCGSLLTRYLFWNFLRRILGLFVLVALLVFLFDFFESSRRLSQEGSTSDILLVTLLRIPVLLERVLPFATLFGSMMAFLSLTRRVELVVLRASGVSVWQFLFPGLMGAALLGILGSVVYSPVAVALKRHSERIEASFLSEKNGKGSSLERKLWFRQETDSLRMIFHARHLIEENGELTDITVYVYDAEGKFQKRLEAQKARLAYPEWHLFSVTEHQTQTPPKSYAEYTLPASLTRAELRQKILEPEALSFWQLPQFIALLERSGLPSQRYHMQYQAWLTLPLLLCAMVLIACAVSLKPVRFGNAKHVILSGIFSGFVLYVSVELARDLGGAGIIDPVIAAWFPPLIAVLLSVTFLLYQEDG